MIEDKPKTIAVLDACVLYPPSLRDLLLRVADAGVYAPRWTEEIHTEWMRNVLADNQDVTPEQLDRTRRLMNQAISGSLVSGYALHIPTLSLPDMSDRHILAAAIKAEAAVIVTFNLSDFPDATLEAYGIQPMHPDIFLSALFEDAPALFIQAMQAHRAALKNPPKTAEEYIQTLRVNGLKRLALRVEMNSTTI